MWYVLDALERVAEFVIEYACFRETVYVLYASHVSQIQSSVFLIYNILS